MSRELGEFPPPKELQMQVCIVIGCGPEPSDEEREQWARMCGERTR